MREFAPGTNLVAAMKLPVKPANLGCVARLILGENGKEVVSGTASFVSTGAEQDVTVPVTFPVEGGPFEVFIDILSQEQRLRSFIATEQLAIAPTALVMSFSNPHTIPGYAGAIFWHARALPMNGSKWIEASDGVKPFSAPGSIELSDTRFVLIIEELTQAWEMRQFGPYYVELPRLGAYTWNSGAGTFSDGVRTVQAINLENMKCQVKGRYQSLSWDDLNRGYGQFIIEEAAALPGKAFINFPMRMHSSTAYLKYDTNIGAIRLVEPNRPVMATFMPVRWQPLGGTYSGFSPTVFYSLSQEKYVKDYPEAAYQFSGSVKAMKNGIVINQSPHYSQGGYEVVYNCSSLSGLPRFAMVLCEVQLYYEGYPQWYAHRYVGPASDGFPYGGARGFELWAHPDPDRPFNRMTALIDNWQKVAAHSVAAYPD